MICQVQFICINWPGALPFSKTLAALAWAERLEEKVLFAACLRMHPCKAVQPASLAGLLIPQSHGQMHWESSSGPSQSA